MGKLEEIKQFITDYKALMAFSVKEFGMGRQENQYQANGLMIHKLSKELGIQAEIIRHERYEYPFEISITIDGFKLLGLLTFEDAKKHKLTKKCPMCNK